MNIKGGGILFLNYFPRSHSIRKCLGLQSYPGDHGAQLGVETGEAARSEPPGVAAPALRQTFNLPPEAHDRGRPRCVPGGGEQVPRELPREGQRGKGTGARRFRRPPARTGKAAGPRSAWGRAQPGAAWRLGSEGKVLSRSRRAKRGRPSDPSGVESSHPELPECRRGGPKLPAGTRRINEAARPPPSWDGSLYGGNSRKETWSGL